MAGTVLLSNMYGAVTRSEDGVIACECEGKVVTALLVLGALAFSAGSVPLVFLGGAGGIPLGALVTPFLMAAAFAAMAVGRRRRHGFFFVDPAKGSFVRGRGGRSLATHPLAELRGLRVVRDYTDGMNLTPAYWLEVAVGGRPYRLAKGSREELAPVIAALAAAGVAGAMLGA